MFGLKHKPKNLEPKPSKTDEEDVSDVLEEVEGVEPESEDDEEYHGLAGKPSVSIGPIIGIVVFLLVFLIAFIPVISEVIVTSSNALASGDVTGTFMSILTLIPLFLAMAGLIVVAYIYLLR